MAPANELHATVLDGGVLQRDPEVQRSENAALPGVRVILVPRRRALIVRGLIDRVIEDVGRKPHAECFRGREALLKYRRTPQPRLDRHGAIDLGASRLLRALNLRAPKVAPPIAGQTLERVKERVKQCPHFADVSTGKEVGVCKKSVAFES